MSDRKSFEEELTKRHNSLVREILGLTQLDLPKNILLNKFAAVLAQSSGCESVELHLKESGRYYQGSALIDRAHGIEPLSLLEKPESRKGESLETLCRQLLSRQAVTSGAHFTAAGSFFTGGADRIFDLTWSEGQNQIKIPFLMAPENPVKSVAIIVFRLEKTDQGLLLFRSTRRDFFSPSIVEFYESIAEVLSVSIIQQQKKSALRERVKELTCLYGIARLADDPQLSIRQVLRSAVRLLPPAWLYPEITSAQIVMDGETYQSTGFSSGCRQLRSGIFIDGREQGFVEVTYSEETPELDEGPFLQEERNLLDAVAKELQLIIEKYRAAREREELQEQLRHADRLATIGQLSAGVAHELNEPLGQILGFAQLCETNPDVSEEVRKDLARIVTASLHAREIVRKLMLFARQSPPEKTWVRLNLLIKDGLYFIESRCRKSGIELVRELEENLPEITADPGQVYQVLINLAVNSIQAMPRGGRLVIRTRSQENGNILVVEDNGSGMRDEVKDKIFAPFFTTKDVGEGTGLGLSVVEGIVNSHGGSIEVETYLGQGTKFTIFWPANAPAVNPKQITEKTRYV